VRVDSGGGQDLWVVAHEGRERLIPAVPEIVVDVSVADRRIVIEPPDGLLDL
jgi:16S rRNA processing protein RimM